MFGHRKCPETSFNFGNFLFYYEYLNSVFRNVRRDIFAVFIRTFIMHMSGYINCLLYVYSYSLISNMSIVLL